MSTNLFIFGAGGLAKEVFILLDDLGYSSKVKGFIVSNGLLLNSKKKIYGKPISERSESESEISELIVAIGNLIVRKNIIESFRSPKIYFPSFIHPKAKHSQWVKFGEGNLVMSGSIITCDIEIGSFCIIDRSCNIGHDSTIGSFCHLCPGVIVSGNVKIENNVFIGAGVLIREEVTITSNVTIGMGAVVVKSIYESGVYVGNPARKIS